MSELLLAYAWFRLIEDMWPKTPGGWGWFAFGLCGNAAFFTRFFVQWIYSEMHKESRVPVAFWWQSIVGTLILLVYFTHRADPIGVFGYVVNVIPYSRNLVLVYRKRRRAAEECTLATTDK